MATNPDIVVSASAPFDVQVMVFEEDTYRVLSSGNHIRDIRAPLEELVGEAAAQQALKVGELAIRGPRVFAIVHDFDLQPSFSPCVIESLLDELCSHVDDANISSLGMQALGAHHGNLPLAEAVSLIKLQKWPACLGRLWISLP